MIVHLSPSLARSQNTPKQLQHLLLLVLLRPQEIRAETRRRRWRRRRRRRQIPPSIQWLLDQCFSRTVKGSAADDDDHAASDLQSLCTRGRFSMDGWMASNVEEIQQGKEKKRMGRGEGRGKGRERDAGMSPIHFDRPPASGSRARGFRDLSDLPGGGNMEEAKHCLTGAEPRGSHLAFLPRLRPNRDERQRGGAGGSPLTSPVARRRPIEVIN